MAIRLLTKRNISTYGSIVFAFLNKNGNEIDISKIDIQNVELVFRGYHQIRDEYCSIVNNHLSIFIDSRKFFPNKILKFDIKIYYSYKGNDKTLCHKSTFSYEPILTFKKRKPNSNSNSKRKW